MRIIGCAAAGTPADDTGIESVNARWKWDGGGDEAGRRVRDRGDAQMTMKKKSDEKKNNNKKKRLHVITRCNGEETVGIR